MRDVNEGDVSEREVNEPRWVRVIVLGSTLALCAYGAVGLLLADLGIYRPLLWIALGTVAFVLLYQRARPLMQPEGESTRTGRISARFAVGLAAVSAIWNASNASQHAQINRDGGIYLNAGKWIATHGTLNLEPFAGPFAHQSALIATSSGMNQHGSHLEFEVSHMLSAFLAEAQNIGGSRLMFAAVPLLSGLALLAFYLLASRLLRHPVAALGATATLAVLMPQVAFSRDSTTEIPIQILLFTGLWMLCDRRALRATGPAFCTGLVFGLVQAMHADGLAFLVGLPAVYAIIWLHTNRDRRAQLKRGMLASVGGIAIGLALGAFDLYRYDRYYLSVVGKNVEKLAAAMVVMIALSIGAVLIVRRTNLFPTWKRVRPRAAQVVGALVLVGGFLAWFARPSLQHVHAGKNPTIAFVQKLNHLPIDATKRYSELTGRWISWYVGPITLTMAIIGAAVLAAGLVRGSLRLPTRIVALMLAPPALLYIWRPSITPDQVWAARRFLPAVFPAVILLAFAVICAIARGIGPGYARQRRSVAVVLAIATVVFPWFTIRNVLHMTEQRGLFPVVTNACRILGPDAAVVILQERNSVAYLSDPQTLRSFCNVPVTVMPGRGNPSLLHSLAAQWRAEQHPRKMFVVAAARDSIIALFPRADLKPAGTRRNLHFLEQTLTRRPSRYAPEIFHLWLAPVKPVGAVLITPIHG